MMGTEHLQHVMWGVPGLQWLAPTKGDQRKSNRSSGDSHGNPRVTDVCRQQRLAHLVRSFIRATEA